MRGQPLRGSTDMRSFLQLPVCICYSSTINLFQRIYMLAPSLTHLRIISPSGRCREPLLDQRIAELRAEHFQPSYQPLAPDPDWPFAAGTLEARLGQLIAAVEAPEAAALLATRGGFGSSDLLDRIPWNHFRTLPPKPIVGFSDISALHAAFYAKLGWAGVHGPMPGTELWGQNGAGDVRALLRLLQGDFPDFTLPLLYLSRGIPPQLSGWGFGGCLSVLTNLIGTPYFPDRLEGALVFWEDIGEHPARIIRFARQWQQSGALDGVKGLILGRFMACEVSDLCTETKLREQLAAQLGLPVWFCPLFGHCSPNWPLPIGRPLRIEGDSLSWDLEILHG